MSITTTSKSHESILVTDATGTVGIEVVGQLSAKGEIIRAAAHSASENTFRNLNRVRTVQLEQITGNKPISFSQFASDYAGAFK